MCYSRKLYYSRCFQKGPGMEMHYFWDILRCKAAAQPGMGCCPPIQDYPPRWQLAEACIGSDKVECPICHGTSDHLWTYRPRFR